MKFTLFITASLLIAAAIPTITNAQTDPAYIGDINGSNDMTRDVTTTLEQTGGNPDINQTIPTDDYIANDIPANNITSGDISFTQGETTTGGDIDYIDLEALENRARYGEDDNE